MPLSVYTKIGYCYLATIFTAPTEPANAIMWPTPSTVRLLEELIKKGREIGVTLK